VSGDPKESKDKTIHEMKDNSTWILISMKGKSEELQLYNLLLNDYTGYWW
jgi:hypothetical protein